MVKENKVLESKGTRPNFTPNEIRGYRIRPDQHNWSVVQVKVKGEGAKGAGTEYESTPMAYVKDLGSAVSYIMRTAGALMGRSYQDEQFELTGVASDLNALTQGFREASGVCIAAISSLEDRIRQAGINLGKGITEDQKKANFGLRGELGDVRNDFILKGNDVLNSIAEVANRAIELSLPVSDDKDNEIRRAALSPEWINLREDYAKAYRTAMDSVDELNFKLKQVGIDPYLFNRYLIKLEGGTGEDTNEENDEVE